MCEKCAKLETDIRQLEADKADIIKTLKSILLTAALNACYSGDNTRMYHTIKEIIEKHGK